MYPSLEMTKGGSVRSSHLVKLFTASMRSLRLSTWKQFRGTTPCSAAHVQQHIQIGLLEPLDLNPPKMTIDDDYQHMSGHRRQWITNKRQRRAGRWPYYWRILPDRHCFVGSHQGGCGSVKDNHSNDNTSIYDTILRTKKICGRLNQCSSILISEKQDVAFVFQKCALCERSPQGIYRRLNWKILGAKLLSK